MQCTLLAILLPVLAISNAGVAPDLSGTWKMTSPKATDPSGAPKSLTYTITQQGNAVEIAVDRDGKKNKIQYFATGDKHIIEFPSATSERVARAHWETKSLYGVKSRLDLLL